MGLKGMGLILVGGIVTCGIQTINETDEYKYRELISSERMFIINILYHNNTSLVLLRQ